MARRTSKRIRRNSRRTSRRPYPVESEQLLVRNARRSGCASEFADWEWLAMDLCAHWRDAPRKSLPPVKSSEDVAKICREFAQKYMLIQEFFGVLCMNQANQPIGFATVSVGGMASAAVDARIVLKLPLLANATTFIVTHNHPSGKAEASADDVELTKRLSDGARLLGLRLLDHIIVADGPEGFVWTSMADAGLLR